MSLIGLISRDVGRVGELGGCTRLGVSNFFHFVAEVLVMMGDGFAGRCVAETFDVGVLLSAYWEGT